LDATAIRFRRLYVSAAVECELDGSGRVLVTTEPEIRESLTAAREALLDAGIVRLRPVLITVGATDIRPEDAAFAECRVNSKIGASTMGGANSDKLDGLGYNTLNLPGVCPTYAAGTAQSKGVGTPIKSGYPGAAATDAANVLAFNLGGHDPITNTAVTPGYVVTAVGAAPIVFVTAKTGAGQSTGIIVWRSRTGMRIPSFVTICPVENLLPTNRLSTMYCSSSPRSRTKAPHHFSKPR